MTLSKKNLKFIDLSHKIARKIQRKGAYHFGGVLVKGSNIVNIGYNSYITHPKSETFENLIHCELSLILGVDEKNLIGSTMYIVRAGRLNRETFVNATPCGVCQGIIIKSGIRKVFFSTAKNSFAMWKPQKTEITYAEVCVV